MLTLALMSCTAFSTSLGSLPGLDLQHERTQYTTVTKGTSTRMPLHQLSLSVQREVPRDISCCASGSANSVDVREASAYPRAFTFLCTRSGRLTFFCWDSDLQTCIHLTVQCLVVQTMRLERYFVLLSWSATAGKNAYTSMHPRPLQTVQPT